MGEVQAHTAREGASKRPPTSAPTAGSNQQLQLKQSVRAAQGFEAQSALLEPVQMFGGGFFGGFGAGLDKKKTDGATGPVGAADKTALDGDSKQGAEAKKDGPATAATQDAAASKKDEPAGPLPDMPRDFGAAGVLRTWIGEFNKSLMKRVAAGKVSLLKKLKDKGWADDNGLSYELLAAAAAQEPTTAPSGKKADGNEVPQGEAPAPVTNARILAMMAKNNAILNKVITPEYQGLCMQFSEKMLKEMGAKRVDGTTNEKRSGAKGPLTALYRDKPIKELPKELPAGYQICATSRPDWGFTEVGNHWFISAGEGFYIDNTGGVHTGQGMTDYLIGTTADQWGSRVVDQKQNSLRTQMGAKFVGANPDFAAYSAVGRTAAEKKAKKGNAPNPERKDASATETEGLAKIKAFVKSKASTYAPRIWIVEPTTKVESSGGAQ